MSEILVPIGPADLIDRLTRLQLRLNQLTDGCHLIERQIKRLQQAADHAFPPGAQLRNLWSELAEVNADLLALDEDLMRCEERGEFGASFVALARARIAAQDSRAQIKQQIDTLIAATLPTNLGVGH